LKVEKLYFESKLNVFRFVFYFLKEIVRKRNYFLLIIPEVAGTARPEPKRELQHPGAVFKKTAACPGN
jgi:hypothetical protein